MYSPGFQLESNQIPQDTTGRRERRVRFSSDVKFFDSDEAKAESTAQAAVTISTPSSPCRSSNLEAQVLPPPHHACASHDEDDEAPADRGHQSTWRGATQSVEPRGAPGPAGEPHGGCGRGGRWQQEDRSTPVDHRPQQVQSQEGQPPGVLRDTVENDVDRNETVPVLQRQALKVIYEVSIPNAMDPVGFGKWASLTYGQLLREQPSYAKWVQETMLEDGNTCDYRLIRLATWLMNQTIDEEAEETEVNIPKPIPETIAGQQGSMTRPAAKVMQVHIEPKAKPIKPGKGYAKEASAARGSHAAASSQDASPAVTAEQFKIMMETMATVKEEIQQLRESKNPEEPRRKKNTETETDTEKSTEKSFQMLLDP